MKADEDPIVHQADRTFGLLPVPEALEGQRPTRTLLRLQKLLGVVDFVELVPILPDQNSTLAGGVGSHIDEALVGEGVDELVRSVLQEDDVHVPQHGLDCL